MLRIVERLFGEGEIRLNGEIVAVAPYTVAVYREWRAEGPEMVAGDFIIEGHLMLPPQQLDPLVGSPELVLRLDDGRWFDFHLMSPDGAIANVDGRPLQAMDRA